MGVNKLNNFKQLNAGHQTKALFVDDVALCSHLLCPSRLYHPVGMHFLFNHLQFSYELLVGIVLRNSYTCTTKTNSFM